jgi:DNA-binding response OmpR family regulator
MSKVLIVEDEEHLAEGLRFNLEAEGYEVTVVPDGEGATAQLLGGEKQFDAVLLDVMLPGKDGFTVASELRSAGQYVPVLMLTARSRPEDVLRGFESGADDYLPKPFELKILLARLRGLLRRREWFHLNLQRDQSDAVRTESESSRLPMDDVYTFAGRTIDFGSLELRTTVRNKSRTIQLTLMEAKLLRHLIANAGRAVSRREILEDVWELREDTDTRAIDNFIVRLRRHIEDDPVNPCFLLTVRGVGYRFVSSSR